MNTLKTRGESSAKMPYLPSLAKVAGPLNEHDSWPEGTVSVDETREVECHLQTQLDTGCLQAILALPP